MRAISDIRLQAIVLLASLVLMGIKFVAWRATQSNAILSDALESIVNVVAGAFVSSIGVGPRRRRPARTKQAGSYFSSPYAARRW